jgi:hypothetical protein
LESRLNELEAKYNNQQTSDFEILQSKITRMNGLFEDRHQSIMKMLDRKAEKEDMLKIEERLIKDIKDLQKVLAMYPEPSELT